MGIAAISSRILVFNSRIVIGRVVYILLLRWSHKKKSHTDKSGDLGGGAMNVTKLKLRGYQRAVERLPLTLWPYGPWLHLAETKD
jgi:hypothetical protein